MASGKSAAPPETSKIPLALAVPRAEAERRLAEQIERGKQMLAEAIPSRQALEEAKIKKRKWRDYASHLLQVLFTNDSVQHAFDDDVRQFWAVSPGTPTLGGDVRDLRDATQRHLEHLESIYERLDLFQEQESPSQGTPIRKEKAENNTAPKDNRKIFIVHGHDEAAKHALARFLKAIDLEPIILQEQANRGDTIIEKFERHADVAFAVVLMTADDIGGKDVDSLQPRARQNVIAELGFFVGRLMRGRVMPIIKGKVEIPTDFSGVVYTEMDPYDGWKMKLAREMEAAGLHIDYGKVARA